MNAETAKTDARKIIIIYACRRGGLVRPSDRYRAFAALVPAVDRRTMRDAIRDMTERVLRENPDAIVRVQKWNEQTFKG
ncbi:MAG: hypothetical protein L6455_13180 [Kiritimatiellae bacterium]|nr:hypothetical protein [Kiritimatiellia bacterium]